MLERSRQSFLPLLLLIGLIVGLPIVGIYSTVVPEYECTFCNGRTEVKSFPDPEESAFSYVECPACKGRGAFTWFEVWRGDLDPWTPHQQM